MAVFHDMYVASEAYLASEQASETLSGLNWKSEIYVIFMYIYV